MAAALKASAQDATYALPFTSFTVEVVTAEDIWFAGPYSYFAKDLLNITVPQADTRKRYIKEIHIVPYVEADPWAPRLYAPAGNSTMLAMSAQGLIAFGDSPSSEGIDWRFIPQVKGGFGTRGVTGSKRKEKRIVYKTTRSEDGEEVRYPVESSVDVDKSPSDKAAEAARFILEAREQRYNIATGNTDASYSGESMAAALNELSAIEKEYLLLFTGYGSSSESSATFEVLPAANARTNRYTAFYRTEDGRIVKDKEGKGKLVPYELEFIPVAVPDVVQEPVTEEARKKPVKPATIHYRIPAICKVRLLEDGNPLMETRIPVYQLGRECEMPVNQ